MPDVRFDAQSSRSLDPQHLYREVLSMSSLGLDDFGSRGQFVLSQCSAFGTFEELVLEIVESLGIVDSSLRFERFEERGNLSPGHNIAAEWFLKGHSSSVHVVITRICPHRMPSRIPGSSEARASSAALASVSLSRKHQLEASVVGRRSSMVSP